VGWAVSLVLLAGCGGGAETALEEPVPGDGGETAVDIDALNTFVEEQVAELGLPGVAIAIVDRDGVLFSSGYGWADVENQVPMRPDTVTNIASISKTFTNAAVLQLRDRGLLALDDDVSQHLPFPVRHPAFPDAAITIRQLLTHTSGIEDGEAYDNSYACGDPAVELADWIRGYFEPGGQFYSEDNFLATGPGEAYSYSNVGYGLLGYLVEAVAGESFSDYTRANIFEPLGMNHTGWYISDIDPGKAAVPYARVEAGDTLDNILFAERNGEAIEASAFVPFCPYSFYNIPDGLVRTSVGQLARYLIAHMRGGEIDGHRVLATSTVDEMLSSQIDAGMIESEGVLQGLAWRQQTFDAGQVWGHSGGDPGVRTQMMFNPETGRGVIVFANRAARVGSILDRLLEEVF
jgi:CubicO group peptidase (beta-lactamase class C family)